MKDDADGDDDHHGNATDHDRVDKVQKRTINMWKSMTMLRTVVAAAASAQDAA